MKRLLSALFCSALTSTSLAWNAIGHKLVAQIAYDNLTSEVKQLCNEYNRAYSKGAKSTFVSNATWLDSIRAKDIHWFDTLHYIDIPFSIDKTPLPPVQEVNALWGMKHAVTVLSSTKSSAADKGLSVRILTHLVGDIHQPLHTVTRISSQFPNGDMGGNLYPLAPNSIGASLHKYWDNGAGILIGQSKRSQIENKARQLEERWPCTGAYAQTKPQEWIKSTHQYALTQVYTTPPNQRPTKKYQLNAQKITEKQIALAGCRLAHVLNSTVK